MLTNTDELESVDEQEQNNDLTGEQVPAQLTTQTEPDNRGAERYRKIIDELYKVFAQLNHYVFDNELYNPVISLQVSKRGPKQTCWCSEQQVWRNKEDPAPRYFDISYHAELIDRPVKEIVSDMLHQMVHIWNAQNGFKDNCRNGTYHNNIFRTTAESHGLICTIEEKKNGFSKVELQPELFETLMSAIDLEAFSISREELVVEKKQKAKKPPSPIHDFRERLNEAIKGQFASTDDAGPCDIAKLAASLCKEIVAEELAAEKRNKALKEEVEQELEDLKKECTDVEATTTPNWVPRNPKANIAVRELVSSQLNMRLVTCPICSSAAFATHGSTIICATCDEEMVDD